MTRDLLIRIDRSEAAASVRAWLPCSHQGTNDGRAMLVQTAFLPALAGGATA